MIITPTPIKDLIIIEPKQFSDSRGYFFESFNEKKFAQNGLNYNFVQDNESKSQYGVLRGLHYQLEPYAQSKLVRAISGEVYDIAVDLRKGSDTFGQWFGALLSGENKKQMLIPKGFAHGFVVLSKEAVFSYKCDQYYHKESERGIKYDDPILKIDWKLEKNNIHLSEKDETLPLLNDSEHNFIFKR